MELENGFLKHEFTFTTRLYSASMVVGGRVIKEMVGVFLIHLIPTNRVNLNIFHQRQWSLATLSLCRGAES